MKYVVNVETNEIIERDFTKQELDQEKKDIALASKFAAEVKAKEAARQAILDRLGLTADEAKLLLG